MAFNQSLKPVVFDPEPPEESIESLWEGDGPESYSPHRVYSFAKIEKQGLGKPQSFRLPAFFTPEIEILVASVGDYENNISHFFRDAIYHRLYYWHERGMVPSELWKSLEVSQRMREYISTQQRRLRELTETLQMLRDAKDRHALNSYIQEQIAISEHAPEPWRSRALAELKKRKK